MQFAKPQAIATFATLCLFSTACKIDPTESSDYYLRPTRISIGDSAVAVVVASDEQGSFTQVALESGRVVTWGVSVLGSGLISFPAYDSYVSGIVAMQPCGHDDTCYLDSQHRFVAASWEHLIDNRPSQNMFERMIDGGAPCAYAVGTSDVYCDIFDENAGHRMAGPVTAISKFPHFFGFGSDPSESTYAAIDVDGRLTAANALGCYSDADQGAVWQGEGTAPVREGQAIVNRQSAWTVDRPCSIPI